MTSTDHNNHDKYWLQQIRDLAIIITDPFSWSSQEKEIIERLIAGENFDSHAAYKIVQKNLMKYFSFSSSVTTLTEEIEKYFILKDILCAYMEPWEAKAYYLDLCKNVRIALISDYYHTLEGKSDSSTYLQAPSNYT